jgi:hypothetical protein
MSISFSIESLTFSGGDTISLDADQILVIVGPNNAGKSRAIRELKILTYASSATRVVTKIGLRVVGTKLDVDEWRERNLQEVPSAMDAERYLGRSYGGIAGEVSQVLDLDKWPGVTTRKMSDQLCLLSSAEERLQLSKPAKSHDLFTQRAEHPVHLLQRDPALLARVSECVRRAFRVDLIPNWGAGQFVPVHCGEKPEIENQISLEYLEELRTVPRLEDQGDGLKSFVGCMFQIMMGPWQVVLLDEPEVFLHPPQAFMLGSMIAEQCPLGRQIVLATHSADLVRGLLESAGKRLKIVRIRQVDGTNPVHELSGDLMSGVAKDPLLKFSNLLDGVFHERLVLCESDADCRFYSAVLRGAGHDVDAMFAHCGGKDRMHGVVSSLRGVGAELVVIADFDVINSERTLRLLWEALGGRWEAVAGEWMVVKEAVERECTVPLRDVVRKEIGRVLEGRGRDPISDGEAESVREIVRFSSPWKSVKRSGVRGLRSGASMDAALRLLKLLRTRGLYVVPCGELERFVPSVGGHGPTWVNQVLESRDLATDEELREARSFVSEALARHARNVPLSSRAPSLGGTEPTAYRRLQRWWVSYPKRIYWFNSIVMSAVMSFVISYLFARCHR